MHAIITSPSLDPKLNVSGVSSVTQFIIDNNGAVEYVHFELGRQDKEKGGWRRIPAILGKLKEWRKVLKQYPDAIIHYNFPLSAPSILRDPIFMLIARWMKRKMVIHIHGGVFLTSPTTPWFLDRILKWVFTGKEPIIVLSDVEKENLIKRYHCQEVIVLPNCIDLSDAEKFKRTADTSIIELGYLGRIAETKGMTELLEACKEMKKQQIPFRLHFAGKEEVEGQYITKFQESLGINFVYEGVVSGESKTAFLKKIDTFVLPSYFEGLPMSLLEAMSFGCVPITTMVGSIPTIINDKENGVAINSHSGEDIVKAVKYLMATPDRREFISNNAQKTIFCRFSPTEYCTHLNMVYQALSNS